MRCVGASRIALPACPFRARALRDVVVRPPVAENPADLSPALREILAKVEVGKLTPPESTSGGIEVFALCEKRETTADSLTKRKLRDEMFQERFKKQADRYLEGTAGRRHDRIQAVASHAGAAAATSWR